MVDKQITDRNEVIMYSFLLRFVLFIVSLFIVFGIVFGVTVMENNYMKPSINASDIMIFYRLERKYKFSDVVIFTKDNKECVGRIAAGNDDEVEITDDGKLKVNGSIVVESKIFYKTPIYGDYVDYPIKLKDKQYFILCDYREGSKDSRYFGVVSEDEIKGKVITLIRRKNI